MNIYINDLSKYYKNKKALDHITLHLSSGIYGLIEGSAGCVFFFRAGRFCGADRS